MVAVINLEAKPNGALEAPLQHVKVQVAGPMGVHDSFRQGTCSIAQKLLPTHPLDPTYRTFQSPRELSSAHPSSTFRQDEHEEFERKCILGRQQLGLHIPLRLSLERNLVSQNRRLGGLPSSNLASAIIMGTDETITLDDLCDSSYPSPWP